MSSKKKRLAGRLAKCVIFDSGSCAFAKRADKRAISRARNSGPLDLELIAVLVKTACVDLEEVDGERLEWRGSAALGLCIQLHQRRDASVYISTSTSTQAQEQQDGETTPTQLAARLAHENEPCISTRETICL